jgi:hypothetical protein
MFAPLVVLPWTYMIAMSRVWLGHHTQIAAGTLLGVCCASFWFKPRVNNVGGINDNFIIRKCRVHYCFTYLTFLGKLSEVCFRSKGPLTSNLTRSLYTFLIFLVVRPTGIGILGDILFQTAEMKLDNDYRL